jgi:CubicO group peptidase (beta-lactamase class C family)
MRAAGMRLATGSATAGIALLAALVAPADAQWVPVSQMITRVDSLAAAAIAAGPLAGLAIGIARGDRVELAKGYGYADLEHRVPVNAETIFRIGSVTKQFTAVALLQLAERGRLRLEDDVSKYVPEYPMRGRRIPLWMLLTHTSGIKNYTELGAGFLRDTFRLDHSPAALVKLFANEPDDFVPGANFNYTNSPFFLAGMVLERVSGLTYAEYLRRNVFDPAGMRSTSYCDDTRIVANEAKGYEHDETGGLRNAPFLSMTIPFSAGALCSNVLDLIAYQRALVGGRLLSPASRARLLRPALLNDGWRTGYGLGIGVDEDFLGERMIGHGGQINGFWVMLTWYPRHDLTVVLLSNVNPARGDGVWNMTARVSQIALGKSPTPVIAERPLATSAARRYAGDYLVVKYPVKVLEREGKLVLGGMSAEPLPMMYVGNHTFLSAAAPLFKLQFEPNLRTGAVDGFRVRLPDIPIAMRGKRQP